MTAAENPPPGVEFMDVKADFRLPAGIACPNGCMIQWCALVVSACGVEIGGTVITLQRSTAGNIHTLMEPPTVVGLMHAQVVGGLPGLLSALRECSG
jgi:hypothetical protein